MAWIYDVSFFIADVISAGALLSLYGCVEVSFNCSTMLSTSSSLSSNACYVFCNFCSCSSMAGSMVTLDLVLRGVLGCS
jgi:hypothetical protein